MKCPICKKGVEWEGNLYRPFCSERCKLIDLGNWASGKYALPDQRAPGKDAGSEKEQFEG